MSLEFLIFILISLALLFSVEVVKRHWKLSTNITRKVTHVGAASIAALSPLFIGKWFIVLGCLSFAVVMLLSRRFTFFASIQNVKRKSLGEVFLPLGEGFTALLFLPNGLREFQYGVLVMGLSDPIAGLIGEKFGSHRITFLGNKKSLEGSAAFFLCTAIITSFFVPLGISIILISLLLTFVELLLDNGFDNLALPIVGATLVSFI